MKRNRWWWGAGLLLLALALVALFVRGGGRPTGAGRREGAAAHQHGRPHTPGAHARLDPDWDGDGQPVSFAFGGDVHFPAGTNLGDRLAADPSDALGPTVPELLTGVDISMVNLESALTDGTCPDAQGKQYVFYAPQSAIDAFKGAGVSLITEANNHGEDCGAAGLQMALTARTQSGYTILGIGQNAAQAFTPYETTVHGERIAIIAATQVIDSDLQSAWTATATQPGLAQRLRRERSGGGRREGPPMGRHRRRLRPLGHRARCVPQPAAGAVGPGAGAGGRGHRRRHACARAARRRLSRIGVRRLRARQLRLLRQLAAGERERLPRHQRHRPAHRLGHVAARRVIVDDLPQPLSGDAATQALAAWNGARSCTNVAATPGTSIADSGTETSPAPAAAVQTLSVDS